jgi:hypothetical protein
MGVARRYHLTKKALSQHTSTNFTLPTSIYGREGLVTKLLSQPTPRILQNVVATSCRHAPLFIILTGSFRAHSSSRQPKIYGLLKAIILDTALQTACMQIRSVWQPLTSLQEEYGTTLQIARARWYLDRYISATTLPEGKHGLPFNVWKMSVCRHSQWY